MVLSAKAAKYDGERGQFDYRHLNVKLDRLGHASRREGNIR